jgi:hypothetical protein
VDKIRVKTPDQKQTAAGETKSTGKTKPTAEKRKDSPGEEKPKRPPQLHTDEEIRGMLAALQAEYPGMSFKDIVKYALRLLCDKIAYLPPIRLRRLAAATLRILSGIAAEAETRAERVTRKIIRAKVNPAEQAKLTDELEGDVAGFGNLRRTMMRQAAIPMVANLPGDVGTGIAVLEREKLECPDKSLQSACDTCIQILRAYRPPELDLPEDLRDPLAP